MAKVRTPRPPLGRIGSSGLPIYAGRVADEWLPALQGPQGQRVYREMSDDDPIIGGILFAIEMLIRQVQWSIQPGSDDAAGEAAAQFIDAAWTGMDTPWADTLSEILTFLIYGWSLHEICYKRLDDGRVGWAEWAIRGQETLNRWEFDPAASELLGMWQLGPPDWRFHLIPLDKALLFRTTARRGNPEGRSLLRNAYRPWYFAKHVEVIEGIGIERDLAGLPVVRVPSEIMLASATDDDKALFQQFQKIATSVKVDEQGGLVLPSDRDEKGNLLYEFELMSSSGGRSYDTDTIIGRYNTQKAITVLADFLQLGHEQVGTQALSSDKTSLFQTAIAAWLDVIAAQVNRHAIPRLLRLNGLPVENPPKLAHDGIEQVDLGALGSFLVQLGQAGIPLDVSPDGPLVKFILKSAGLPELPEGTDLAALAKQKQTLAVASAPPQPQGQGQPTGRQNGAQNAPGGTQRPASKGR